MTFPLEEDEAMRAGPLNRLRLPAAHPGSADTTSPLPSGDETGLFVMLEDIEEAPVERSSTSRGMRAPLRPRPSALGARAWTSDRLYGMADALAQANGSAAEDGSDDDDAGFGESGFRPVRPTSARSRASSFVEDEDFSRLPLGALCISDSDGRSRSGSLWGEQDSQSSSPRT